MKASQSASSISGSLFGGACPASSLSSSAVSSSNISARENTTSGCDSTDALRFCSMKYSGIPSLHPVVCTSDGRGRPAQAKEETAGRGGKFMRAVIRAARALDDHWIGDLIGAVCMIGAPCVMLILGHAMGWQ